MLRILGTFFTWLAILLFYLAYHIFRNTPKEVVFCKLKVTFQTFILLFLKIFEFVPTSLEEILGFVWGFNPLKKYASRGSCVYLVER